MEFQSLTPEELLGPLNEVEKKNAPDKFFVIGNELLVSHYRLVSVVGSRKASANGLKRAETITKMLVERDIVIVSGLAEGVDTVAHTTAIKSGGNTVAVIGTSLDKYYPAQNKLLQEQIARDHLLVSQFPIGTVTQPKHFPMRNRIMALLSDATIIVEAGEGSGTIHQGWEALRLGRPLFLLESIVQDKSLKWSQEFLKHGAEVLSRDKLELFFEEFLPQSTRHELESVAF